MKIFRIIKKYKLLSAIFIILVVGILLYLTGQEYFANVLFVIVSLWVLVPMSFSMIKDALAKKYGLDILAVIAVATSLALGELVASVVIVLMIASGKALEEYAEDQAKKELNDLLKRAPKIAHLKKGNSFEDVAVEKVLVNDYILIKPGEVVPVDCKITKGSTSLDESAITGESMPVDKVEGELLLSGSINNQASIEAIAVKNNADSQYEQIVSLVSDAASSKSPFVRLADAYSVPFTIVSLLIAAIAWIYTGQPERALEVLVLATPCPLLIATPVALVAGMSKGAKRGIIYKNGSALENLAKVKMIAFDKTGTLTVGEPMVEDIISYEEIYSKQEILQIAASAEALSGHTLALAVVNEAQKQDLQALKLDNVQEVVGSGVRAIYKKQSLLVGKASFLEVNNISVPESLFDKSHTTTLIAINNKCIGAISFQDILRPETSSTLAKLKQLGVNYIAMLTGDKKIVAQKIAKESGITHIQAECLPADKLKALKSYKLKHSPLAFVGDGINDAPSLAAADIGIALGAKGSTAASEAASIVIMLDDLRKVASAVSISKRTIKIAKQSIFLGIGLSIVLMLFAGATGLIKPVYGALIQELVDVSVILLALRARK
jgi:heavy metal translocating P-type ATPase